MRGFLEEVDQRSAVAKARQASTSLRLSWVTNFIVTIALSALGLVTVWLTMEAAGATEVVTTKVDGTTEVDSGTYVVYFPLAMLPAAVPNGDFESRGLAPWQAGGELLSNPAVVAVPTPLPPGKPPGVHAALLGKPMLGTGNTGGIPIGSAWISQTVHAPVIAPGTAAATLRLILWYRVFSHDTQWNGAQLQDTLDVKVGDTIFQTGNPTTEYGQPTPWDSGWRCQRIDLPALTPGQPVELRFEVHNRNDAYYNTWAYVDDIVLSRQADCPRESTDLSEGNRK